MHVRLALRELDQRLRAAKQKLTLVRAPAFRVEDALRRLTAMLGGPDWQNLLFYLPSGLDDELLEECDEPVALPDPGRPARRLPRTDENPVLPEDLKLMPGSGSYPGPAPRGQ